jgi:hypothetical protein
MSIQKIINHTPIIVLNRKRLQPQNSNNPFTISNFKSILILFFAFFSLNTFGQWFPPCEDSLRKNLYFQCNEPFFRPVCGCNNKTYRNECVSYNVHGINVIKNEGVCKDQVFEFDFYPNPAVEHINFALEFYDIGNMTVQIFDTYGKLMFVSHKTGIHRFDDLILTNGFKTGLYVITVLSGNTFKTKKLIVR